jgi:hypothetical protein
MSAPSRSIIITKKADADETAIYTITLLQHLEVCTPISFTRG